MTYVEAHARDLGCPPDAAWEVLSRAGGHRWWTPLPLWQLRGVLDRAVGGPGFRLQPTDGPLQPGDTVDFWEVESATYPALRLRALTRLPGTAYLGVTVEPRGAGSRLVLRSEFDPHGLPGHAYWWANLAVHKVVFRLMADRWAALLDAQRDDR